MLVALTRHGCDLFMDLHGDEKLPHNFLSGSEGVPRWLLSPRLRDLQRGFVQALMQVGGRGGLLCSDAPSIAATAASTALLLLPLTLLVLHCFSPPAVDTPSAAVDTAPPLLPCFCFCSHRSPPTCRTTSSTP